MIIRLKGTVVHGLKLGREIGFKTANIKLEKGEVTEGTYKINGIIEGEIYPWVGSYLTKKGVFEAHFFEFEKDIYDKEIEVIILGKIRENRNFSSLDEIKKQITQDIKSAKKTENNVLTFGTFDIVHEGHKYYLKEAKKLGDKLITIVAQDKNVQKFKWQLPLYKQTTRKKHIQELGISDKVIIGYGDNPLKWIDVYHPTVICLWYDQAGFINLLEAYKKEKQLNLEIIRLEPFQEHIYKSSILKKRL